ncbi:aluminum-activated malate transporter 10, partial [Tanacetum coccineum]
VLVELKDLADKITSEEFVSTTLIFIKKSYGSFTIMASTLFTPPDTPAAVERGTTPLQRIVRCVKRVTKVCLIQRLQKKLWYVAMQMSLILLRIMIGLIPLLEPTRGRFKFRHSWKQYLRVGDSMHNCADCIQTLNGFTSSEVQVFSIAGAEHPKKASRSGS